MRLISGCVGREQYRVDYRPTNRQVTLNNKITSFLGWAAALVGVLVANSAVADVTLVEKDGWTVFMNGRIQAFANYNVGTGKPRNLKDNNCATPGDWATCSDVEIRGGGIDQSDALTEWPAGTDLQRTTDRGVVQELRLRTGFTGNVLGFGIKKQLTERTEILGYTAVTVGIDSDLRRKFSDSRPDWRESYLRLSGPAGTLSAGRMLTLHSRGATEITYLYGYRYGLGFAGGVSSASRSSAGSVGFGVLGNGFGAGLTYATPSFAGVTLEAGIYDANNVVGTQLLERTRWPRVEFEGAYDRAFPWGVVKVFANGAWQELYDYSGTPRKAVVWGVGYGGRLEVGPFRLGLAGHRGQGIGVTYALEPHGSLYFVERAQAEAAATVKMRTVEGYYAQAQVWLGKAVDVRAGAGVTHVQRIEEDVSPWNPETAPSVGWVILNRQIGLGGGATYHYRDQVHFTAEVFYADFEWYRPIPDPGGMTPKQYMQSVNLGVTYDF